MPAGLQVFDASGALTFDGSVRTSRILGAHTISAESGSFVVPASPLISNLFAYWAGRGSTPTDINYPLGHSHMYRLSISGMTVAWSSAPVGAVIIYGDCAI